MSYKHITIEEREQIQKMLWKKASIRQIAQVLGRSPSSVSREIKRNRSALRKSYTPRLTHQRALQHRTQRGREERLKNQDVRDYTLKHLKLGWSPEQISNTIEKNIGEKISYEAIYQYVYHQIHRDGYGYLKPNCEDLRPYLARRRKRRTDKGLRKSYRTDKGPLPSIEKRPKEVEERNVIGHWEDDLIVSRASKFKLKTVNERVSGLVFISKLKDGTIIETNRAIKERFKKMPKHLFKTLTRDRGSENMGYQELEEELDIKCFFAHAYSSWERGSNENTNGLIRRYFPKKTDFKNITEKQIQMVEHLLNTRPRKRLGWKTPYEVFYELTGVALES